MAGSNPNITATVTAVDHATQTLQNVAELAKRITKESNSALAQSAVQTHAAIAEQAVAAHGRLQALRSAASEAAVAMGASFAGMATGIIHKSMEVGMAIERQIAKMRSFTDASARDITRIRDMADTEGAKLPGGNVGFVEASRAASMSGVRPDLVGIAAKHGLMFSYETGDDPARGTENLLSHAAMLQDVKNDKGAPIPVREANAAQLERALTHAQNLLIEINKQAPGNLQDVYEGFKFGGPAALGAHIAAPQLAALYTQLAEHGIRGSEAGVAARGGFASLEAPTAKGRMTAAALGVDIDRFRQIDPTNMTADKILNGLSQRVGHDKAEHIRAAVEGAVDGFKKTGDTRQFNDALTRNIQHLAKNLQDNVRASNLARDVMTPFVKSIDFSGFIKALKDSGAEAGAFNQIFGSKMGGKLIVLDGDRLSQLSSIFGKAQSGDNYEKSVAEFQSSYAGRMDRLTGSLSALADRIFQANKPLIEKMAGVVTSITEFATKHPNASAALFDTAAVVGFVGALRAGTKILKAVLGDGAVTVAGKVVGAAEGAIAGGLTRGGTAVAGATAGASAATVAAWAGGLAAFDAGVVFTLNEYQRRNPEKFRAHAEAAYAKQQEFGPFRHFVVPPGRNQGYRGHYEIGKDEAERADIMRRALPQPTVPRATPRTGVAPHPWEIGGRQVFGGEGSGAFITGGINHNSGVVRGIETTARALDGAIPSLVAGIQSAMAKPQTIQGDVKGEATLVQTIKIEPTPMFIGLVEGARRAMSFSLNGKLGQTMSGSNATKPSTNLPFFATPSGQR